MSKSEIQKTLKRAAELIEHNRMGQAPPITVLMALQQACDELHKFWGCRLIIKAYLLSFLLEEGIRLTSDEWETYRGGCAQQFARILREASKGEGQ